MTNENLCINRTHYFKNNVENPIKIRWLVLELFTSKVSDFTCFRKTNQAFIPLPANWIGYVVTSRKHPMSWLVHVHLYLTENGKSSHIYRCQIIKLKKYE